MEPNSREIPPTGPEPGHHHPVPSGLVRLYGLFAVLLVLLPEWMADLRQMSRSVRVQARGDLDQDRLSLTLRRRLAARRRRELKAKASPDLAATLTPARPSASSLASPSSAPVAPSQPLSQPQSQPHSQRRAWQAVAQATLLVGVGAALVWGAYQIKPGASSRGAFGPRPGALAGGGAAVAPVPAGQLRLESRQPSWVEVRTLEGRTLYAAILKGRVQLPLGGGLKVLAGRPDLVRASRGAQLPQPLGTIDRITWVVFDAPAPASAQNPAP